MILKVYQFLAYWMALGIFFAGLLGLNLIAPILRLLFREKSRPLCQSLIKIFSASFLRLTRLLGILSVRYVDWPDEIHQQPGIFVANHPSKLDAVLLLARLPRAFCVFKDSLRSSLLLGPTSKSIGFVSNAEGTDGLRTAISQVKQNMSFIVFPEGTRSTPGSLNHLGGSYSVVSKYSSCDVHILRIDTNSNLLGKDHSFWHTPEIPVCVTVRYLDRRRPIDFATAGNLHASVSQILRNQGTSDA